MSALKAAMFGTLAVAALAATSSAAAPMSMRIVVGNLAVSDGLGQTRETAIMFLKNELEKFFNDTGGQDLHLEVYFEPVSLQPGTSPVPNIGTEALRRKLDSEPRDILAYINAGQVVRGKTRVPTILYNIIIRPPNDPPYFQQVKSTIGGISYQHRMIMAYALMMQQYSAGNSGVAAALAARMKRHYQEADDYGPSRCLEALNRAATWIELKARERNRPGATGNDNKGVPSWMKTPLLCDEDG